jgi:hypothetical protein
MHTCALKLKDKANGKLYYATNLKAFVWTSDRRIQIDGGLWKALSKRIKKVISIFPFTLKV